MKTDFWYLFHLREFMFRILGSNSTKVQFLGRGSLNMLIFGVVVVVRVVVNCSNSTILYFFRIHKNLFWLRFHFGHFQRCKWTESSFFCHLPDPNNFHCFFFHFFVFFDGIENCTVSCAWIVVFISENRFFLSISVFEKKAVEIRVLIESSYTFSAELTLLC